MKITQLSSKPQLVAVTLDSPEIVAAYGEPVEFWTWDRQPLEVFMKLASASTSDQAGMVDVLRTLIMDEKGKQVISEGNMIPSDILVAAMVKVTEILGKQ
jgi:deoxyhypusine synthase